MGAPGPAQAIVLELQRALMDGLGGGPRRSVVTARWRRVCKPIVARLQITRRPAPRDPGDTAARRPRPADNVRSRDDDPHAAAPGHHGHTARELAARAPDAGEAGRARRPKHPARVREVTLSYPQTLWLAEGTAPEDLHNEAARYDTSDDVLTVNPDFPIYRALLEQQLDEHSSDPEAAAIITEKLRQWWELMLVECIDIAKRLPADPDELAQRTSIHALTAAMSPLSPIAQHLRREVPQQLGRHDRSSGPAPHPPRGADRGVV